MSKFTHAARAVEELSLLLPKPFTLFDPFLSFTSFTKVALTHSIRIIHPGHTLAQTSAPVTSFLTTTSSVIRNTRPSWCGYYLFVFLVKIAWSAGEGIKSEIGGVPLIILRTVLRVTRVKIGLWSLSVIGATPLATVVIGPPGPVTGAISVRVWTIATRTTSITVVRRKDILSIVIDRIASVGVREPSQDRNRPQYPPRSRPELSKR